ncbi:DUF6086 family protein [Streptomyces violascens]|uniref:DUF6086 family protein n=1 Tax=Streptomyces violascens TaxID=67381 RepID=UPI0036863824
MSCYFQVADDEVWNPSNAVAQLFLSEAVSLARLIGTASGLGEITEDECEIDPDQFAAFVDALISTYQSTNNTVLRSLLRGFIPVALALVERTGKKTPSMQPEYADAWAREAEVLSHSMPRG